MDYREENPINGIEYPNVYDGYQYALDVVSGIRVECVYVIGACKRFLSDYEKTLQPDSKYIFDHGRAERYLKLVQLFPHVKGTWETVNVVFLNWQKFIFMNIMGFLHRNTNNPRFRTAHVELPRGHGKSLVASQAVLYFLALDNPKGNEISCASTKTEQARIVLDSARAMAKASPNYLKATGVQVLAHKVIHEKSNSFARALSADSKSLDGLNDILCVMDELHAVSRELYDVISSGMSKRRDSLLLCITTAGFDNSGVGYSQSQYAKKVCLGDVPDDQFFAIVYTIDEGDDIFSEDTWKKANPGYGGSVDPVTFAAKAEKAKVTPADLPNFKVKHLNIWLSEAKAFYDLSKWDECYDPTLTYESLAAKKAHIGIDLASKIDLTSFFTVCRDRVKNPNTGEMESHYYLWDKTYIPELTASEVNNDIYNDAIAKGFLIATKGEAINYSKIEEDFKALGRHVKVLSGLFDPWNAISFGQNMIEANFNMREFRMNTANLSEATKELDALMRQKKIHHNGSPLIRWCLGNVVCKEDAAGNVYPRKSHEKLKIDPIVALIMAIAAWMQETDEQSVYEIRGVRFL
jgi:phage terminase large subunit-like protein